MRAGSLCGAVASRLERLVAGDARPCQRAVGALLEDRAQPLERAAQLALQPPAQAERLLERVPRDARFGPHRDGHLGGAGVLGELPFDPAGCPAPAADAAL